MRREPTVLVLAGRNDRATLACVRSLHSGGTPFKIVLPAERETVYDPYNTVWSLTPYRSLIFDGRYESVDTGNEAFRRSVGSFATRLNQPIVFPIGEKEMRAMLEDESWLENNDIQLPLPTIETYTEVSDKSSFAKLVREYGIRTPGEYSYHTIRTRPPFVAKPKSNVSERGRKLTPYLLHTDADVSVFEAEESVELFFYQEYIDGPSVYYCSVWDSGTVVGEYTQKTVRQQPNGKSVIKAALIELDPGIRDKLRALLADLEWHGPIMIELKRQAEEYYMIEANPRFWGPLQLGVDNGYDFPRALYAIATGQQSKARAIANPADKRHDTVGYKWSTGYLNGMWMKLFEGGKFQTAVPPRPGCTYRDVQFRRDTWYNHFIYDLVGQGLTPASVVLYEQR